MGIEETEEVSCAVCGETKGRILFRVQDKLSSSSIKKYPLIKCANCGLAYLSPRPAPSAKAGLYNQDYLFNPGRLAQPIGHYHPVIEQLRQRQPGKVLDVGTGNSPFLPYMKKEGWDVCGTEVNHRLVEWFKEENGIKLYEGELEELRLESGFFDAVTIMGVLEHAPHPRRLLEEAHRILKDDGILCFWGFNRSVEAALLGKYWMGFDAPRHLYSFSAGTLEKLLAAAGFTVTRTDFAASGSVGHSAAWVLARARSRVTGNHESHDYLLNLPAPVKVFNAVSGRALAAVGKSATFYLYAAKTKSS